LTQSIGSFLKSHREQRRMSLEEVARVTRIPTPSLESIEADRFDELPGEVFVRGFLKSYAHYTSSRRLAFVTPLPIASPVQAVRQGNGRRFGVAIAFVLLLILFTLALSIVLKPRGRDVPAELSQRSGIVVGGEVSST
jgi:transcriptional regulator with XRE-family HTH domain